MSTFIILALDNLHGADGLRFPQELIVQGTMYPIGSNCPAYLTKFDGTAADLQAYLAKIRTPASYKKFLIAEVCDINTVLLEDQKVDLASLIRKPHSMHSTVAEHA